MSVQELDLFLMLVAANPVRALERNEYGDEVMLSRIIAAGKPNRLNTPRIRRGWVIGGVSVVMMVAAAYALLRHEAPDNPTTMMCYSEPSANPTSRQELSSTDPIAACKEVWASGKFGTREVPPLTACITGNGVIAVVPGGDQACTDLGYSLWRSSFDSGEKAIIEFQEQVGLSLGRTCYSERESTLVVQELLTEYGLDGWTIVGNDDWTDARPCTASGIDPASKTVTLGSREFTP